MAAVHLLSSKHILCQVFLTYLCNGLRKNSQPIHLFVIFGEMFHKKQITAVLEDVSKWEWKNRGQNFEQHQIDMKAVG